LRITNSGGYEQTRKIKGVPDMTDQIQDLVEEICRRMSEVPKGTIIDSLAWATSLGSGYSTPVEEIRHLVQIEAAAAGIVVRDRS
jgi:hypothetical protein